MSALLSTSMRVCNGLLEISIKTILLIECFRRSSDGPDWRSPERVPNLVVGALTGQMVHTHRSKQLYVNIGPTDQLSRVNGAEGQLRRTYSRLASPLDGALSAQDVQSVTITTAILLI